MFKLEENEAVFLMNALDETVIKGKDAKFVLGILEKVYKELQKIREKLKQGE